MSFDFSSAKQVSDSADFDFGSAKPDNPSLIDRAKTAVGWNTGRDIAVQDGVTRDASEEIDTPRTKRNIRMENSIMRGYDGMQGSEQSPEVSALPSVQKVTRPALQFERQKDANRQWLDDRKPFVVDQLSRGNSLSPENAEVEFARMRAAGVIPKATETGLREATWSEAAGSSLDRVKPSFNRAMSGIASAMSDATGDYAMGQNAEALRMEANRELAAAQGRMGGTEEGTWKNTIGNVAPSLAQNLPGLLLTAATKNPVYANLGLAGMGASTFGDSYAEGKDLGLNGSNNAQQALLKAAAEVGPEKLSLNSMMRMFGKIPSPGDIKAGIAPLAKEFAKQHGVEHATEQMTTAMQAAVDKLYTNPDLTLGDWGKQVAETFRATAIQGPLLAGAGMATNVAANAARKAYDPLGYELQGYEQAVNNTNFAPLTGGVGQDTDASNAARQSALNAWSQGFNARPAPRVPKTPEQILTDYINGTGDLSDEQSPADQILALEGNGNAAEVDAKGNQGQRSDGTGSYGNLQPMPGLDGRGSLNAGTPVVGGGANQSVGSPGGNNGAINETSKAQTNANAGIQTVDPNTLPERSATGSDELGRSEILALQGLGRDSGAQVEIVSGVDPDGKLFHGYAVGRSITIHTSSANMGLVTMAHEIGHVIENTSDQGAKEWGGFESVVLDEAANAGVDLRSDAGLLAYAQQYAPQFFKANEIAMMRAQRMSDADIIATIAQRIGRNYDAAAIRAEFAKDVFGNAMASKGFMSRVAKRLAKENLPALAKMVETIDGFIAKLNGARKQGQFSGLAQTIAQLERVRDEAAKVYADHLKRARRMETRTIPELFVIARSNPDADIRDAAQAEIKRRETEAAYAQREQQATAEGSGFAAANRQARMDQLEAEAVAAGQDAQPAGAMQSALSGAKRDAQADRRAQQKADKQLAANARGNAKTVAQQLNDNEEGRYSPKRPGSDVGHKRTKSGEYVGAPPGMTASKLGKLRNTLRALIEEGKDGRMWYEESSDAILASAEGDRAFAEKISGLLAIYSPNATVSGNATMGIKALYQWANGEPIKVRFPDQDRKAQAWMDGTISNDDALKIKTGNFHRNLMRKIDEENYGYDKQGATIDMWMARVFGYGSEARYYFAERETKQLAKELGWEPRQVQAALWVAIKARVEAIRNEARDIGLKKGWVKEKIKNGNISYEPVNAEAREKYEGLILKMALAADRSVTDEFIHKGVYNFATALKERVGQLSWEAMPGKTTGVLPGIFDAPLEQQAEYLAAIDAALRDENGGDLIAKKLDLPVLQTSFGPSAWQMNVGAGAQTEVVIPTDREQKSKNISVNQNAKDLLNTYAAIRGYVLAQEAVVWHYPIFDAAKKNANGVQLDFGRDPTHEEVKALYQAIYEASGRDDWAPAYVPGVGVRVLNFAEPQFDKEANEWTYLDANKVEHRAATKEELMPKARADGVDNATFQKLVKKAAASLPEDLTIHFDTFKSDGDYIWNNWKESPNGEDYRQRISRSGRSDLQGWVESELRPRVERVNQEFSDKYGWGKARFSLPRSDAGSAQRAGAVAAEGSGEVRSYGTAAPGAVSVQGFHYSTAERSQLDGRYYGTGTKGEEYARVMSSRDPRIKERIYFYVDAGRGITPEQGVGSVGHTVNLNNVYDGTNDTWLQAKISRDLKGDEWMNAFESAVIDNGFDGYVSDFGTQRAAVLLGRHSVKVQPTQATRGAVTESKPAQENAGADAVAKSRVLPGGKMSGADWKRMVPAVVPGADVSMLEDGKDYYKDDVVAAMRGVKYSLGRTINIDGVERPTQNSNGKPIAQTEEGLRNFWRWFGDSRVVDAEGRPLVVYHGTLSDFSEFQLSERGLLGKGIYLTPKQNSAEAYAKMQSKLSKTGSEGMNIMPVYARMDNPFILENDPLMGIDSAKIEALGHDGIIRINNEVITQMTVFNPAQTKSATGNRGTFDGSNPDIRYSTARNILGSQINGAWVSTEVTGFDNVVRQMQDKLVDTKRVVQAIKAQGSQVATQFDPYKQEILFHGRAAKRVHDFADGELRPLLQDMMRRKVEMAELENYLWARHAVERNAQIAKVNPNMPDGGSGLTNQQARDVMAGRSVTVGKREVKIDPAKMQHYAALAQRIDAITNETLNQLVAYGLETQETVDAWRNAYKYYVPLNRDLESDDNFLGAFNLGLGTGQGFSVRGSSSRRAQGSGREVTDILANLAMQRERAIVKGEKNRVSMATYGLALKSPNPDFWLPINPDAKNRPLQDTIDELVRMGLSPMDAQSIATEPKQRYVDPRTGMVTERINPALRNRADVLSVRINGQDRYLMFSNDQRAQEMVRNLKSLDDEHLKWFLQKSASVTRWFASVNTQYNPVFGIVNGIRDAQSALLNLGTTPIAGKKAKVMQYGMSALAGIYQDLRAHRDGRAPSSPWALEFEEFANEGGQTGYRDMFQTSKARTDALTDTLKELSAGKVARWFKMNESNPIFAWLSDYNTTIENAFRLAAYKVAKEQGISKAEAALIAKNLTVNFNKKGLAATQTGALYAFFNAAVQGTARIGETMLEHRGDPSKASNLRLSKLGKKIVLGGSVLGVMQAVMFALAGYDDDEPKQFQREKNIIIPDFVFGSDKYVSIPMPLGFHVIPGTTRIMTEFALSGGKDPGKRLTQLLGLYAEAFNPIGSAGVSLQTILPTVADPLAALATNRDWNGQKIFKEDFNKNHPTPGWTRKKDSASPLAQGIAYGINWISGGFGPYERGLMSPTPDQIDYLAGQVFGGTGREIIKLSTAAKSLATGEDLPMYKVPLAGRFIGETKGVASETGRYYENLSKIGEHQDPIKRMKADNQTAMVDQYIKDHPESKLVKLADHTSQRVSEIDKQRRKLIEKDAPREEVKKLEERKRALMAHFNRMVEKEMRQ